MKDLRDAGHACRPDMSGCFLVPPMKRFVMFLCSWLLCYIVGSVIMGFVMGGELSATKVRICLVIQDVVVFVVPALLTAVAVCRRPAELLLLTRPKSLWVFVMVVMLVVSMIPAINMVISWNQTLRLPDSMNGLYEWMVESERSAEGIMSLVTGSTTVGGLIISLLIVGVFAGFSEELFLRGGLQRLLTTSSVNPHVAIWLTAFIFSAIHLQFFGFFPRLILGGVFGYLAYWSGTLWVPVVAHVTNNCLAVAAMWIKNRSVEGGEIGLDTIGSADGGTGTVAIVLCSVLLSVIWLGLIYKRSKRVV